MICISTSDWFTKYITKGGDAFAWDVSMKAPKKMPKVRVMIHGSGTE